MNLKRPHRPTAYAKSDSLELKSVKILEGLINEDLVKTHFSKRSTVPNTDGTLQIVDQNQIPLGNFDVQIKTLNEKDKKRNAFNIDCGFLAYCSEAATNPVLLFAVNHKEKFSLWEHISKELALSLLEKAKGNTITISFSEKNRIVEGNTDYYHEWISIHDQYRKIFEVVNDLKKEEQRFKIASAILNDVNTAVPLPGDGVKLQQFTDHLNNLFDNDFKAIKKVFYPNTWKLGLGLFSCSESSLSYTVYSIKNGSTDLQIKQLDLNLSKKLHKIGFVSYYPHSNPIYKSPKKFAMEFVAKKVGEFLKHEAYETTSVSLAEESIFHAIVNDRYKILGFSKNQDRIDIHHLKSAIENYLPTYLGLYLIGFLPPEFDNLINLQLQMDGYVNIDDLLSFQMSTPSDIVSNIENQITQKLKLESSSKLPFPIYSKSVPLKKFHDSIKILESNGITEVARPYKLPKNLMGPYRWSNYDYDDLLFNFQKVFQDLPDTFDEICKLNFQEISDDLKFYNDFDTMIVHLEPFSDSDPRGIGPVLKIFNLITEDKDIKNKVIFLPKDYKNVFEDESRDFFIKYLGKKYKLRSYSRGFHNEIFDSDPLSANVRKLLHERLESYFKKNGVSTNWGPPNSY